MPMTCSLGLSDVEHLVAERLLGDPLHEGAGDLVGDVRLEQRLLDELQPVAHVRLGQLALAAERLERRAEVLLEGVEHAGVEGVTASRERAGQSRIVRESPRGGQRGRIELVTESPSPP